MSLVSVLPTQRHLSVELVELDEEIAFWSNQMILQGTVGCSSMEYLRLADHRCELFRQRRVIEAADESLLVVVSTVWKGE